MANKIEYLTSVFIGKLINNSDDINKNSSQVESDNIKIIMQSAEVFLINLVNKKAMLSMA